MFDGEEDAYWWVLCTEKHFKELGTPEEVKVTTAVTKLKGRPLYWWLWWSHYHPEPSWDAFTTVFLWRFKPEWRHLLPISDEKEEPYWQSPLLTMQGDNDAQGPTRMEDEITVPALGDLQKEEENPKEDGFRGRSSDTSQSGGDGNESRPLKNPAKPVPLSKSSARKFYVAATGIPVAGGLTIPPPPPKLPNAKLHGDGHVLLPVESTRVRTAVDTLIPDTEPYDLGPLTSIFPTTKTIQLHCSPSPPTLVFSPASTVTTSCDCLIFQLSHNILVGNSSPSTLKSEILFDSNVLPMLPNDPNRDKPVVASVFSFILAAGATVIPILNEGGFYGCGIWKSTKPTTMRTFSDTYRVFDAMTLSGNCYFHYAKKRF